MTPVSNALTRSDLGGYRYAAFGKQLAADAKTPTPTVDQPLRWKGRWWSDFGGPDGTYDMRARVWSPELGIFLSADAFAYHDARGTLWSWPNQNPVNLSDPSGNCPNCLVGGVVGGVIGGLSYAFTASTSLTWGQFAQGAAAHIAAGAALGAIAGLNPYAGLLVFGATQVSNENEIGKFAFPIFLGAAFQESCPTRAGGAIGPKGARGPASGRNFDPSNAGGPVRNLSTAGVRVTPRGIEAVEGHLSRFGPDTANSVMVERLRQIAAGELEATVQDMNFYTHELRESVRYRNLGHPTGDPGYDVWNNAHSATLEDYGLNEQSVPHPLYHPDALGGD